jgi:hypothetical protein
MLTDGPTLLAEIDRFLRSGFCSETYFGRLTVQDGKLIKRLRAGGSVTVETAAQIISFINKAEGDKRPPRGRGRPSTTARRMTVKDEV